MDLPFQPHRGKLQRRSDDRADDCRRPARQGLQPAVMADESRRLSAGNRPIGFLGRTEHSGRSVEPVPAEIHRDRRQRIRRSVRGRQHRSQARRQTGRTGLLARLCDPELRDLEGMDPRRLPVQLRQTCRRSHRHRRGGLQDDADAADRTARRADAARRRLPPGRGRRHRRPRRLRWRPRRHPLDRRSLLGTGPLRHRAQIRRRQRLRDDPRLPGPAAARRIHPRGLGAPRRRTAPSAGDHQAG